MPVSPLDGAERLSDADVDASTLSGGMGDSQSTLGGEATTSSEDLAQDAEAPLSSLRMSLCSDRGRSQSAKEVACNCEEVPEEQQPTVGSALPGNSFRLLEERNWRMSVWLV